MSTGAVTITASDPSATLSGTAALVVTPAELGPSVTTTPSSGPKRILVLVQGANFVPDQSVTVTYVSKKFSTVLCDRRLDWTGHSAALERSRLGVIVAAGVSIPSWRHRRRAPERKRASR